MKDILYKTIACCAAALLSAACQKSEELPGPGLDAGSDLIYLDFRSGASGDSGRAIKDDDTESRVEHLDVLIFEDDGGSGAKRHYERISPDALAPNTTETLTAKRSDFTSGKKYWVYLIANATDEEKTAFSAADFNLGKLRAKERTDLYIHLTGLPNQNSANITLPQTFLMDGIAYPDTETGAGAVEPTTAGPVVLNDGNIGHNTYLAVTLRRAAVKLQLKISKGPQINFTPIETTPGITATGGYYLRNMPYTTPLVEPVVTGDDHTDDNVKVRTTTQSRSSRYEWQPELITAMAYVYSHRWATGSSVEREPRWIMDIPISFTPQDEKGNATGQTQYYDHCYYQIPVCNGDNLKRNTCYTVSLTLNIPGGNTPSEPVELNNVSFEVADWVDKSIQIGGSENNPKFLTVNRTEMDMHNTEKDATTLQFSSSSAVTVRVTRAYYVDKFGQEQNERDEIINQIKLTPDPGLSGNITVESPMPTNKTIRYIEIEVTNEDGSTPRTVTIKQYPLENITNIQSWYSYRDDFKINDAKPTTYEYIGDRIYGISLDAADISSWTGGYTYEASYRTGILITWETNTSSGFFRSKYAVLDERTGKSRFYHYYYDSNNRLQTSNSNEYNARLYHIVLTSSSETYTLGRPRQIMDDISGLLVTDPKPDNAKLVSPSFMIASSLSGFIIEAGNLVMDDSPNSLRVAREHCAHYVEVYKDKEGKSVVLDDWRLPTKAELDIILNFQGSENQDADAIDYLLNADYYYCAGGRVFNDKYNLKGGEVRCVRDVYDDPTAGKGADPAAGDQ